MSTTRFITLVATLLVFYSCIRLPIFTSPPTTPLPVSTTAPLPAPILPLPPNSIPPPAITSMMAVNAYNGRVNLWWQMSPVEGFDHYNIYVSKSQIVSVAGMRPVHQIKDANLSSYQATGLENGTRYYFVVTVVDKSGNEKKQVASVNITPAPMPRGIIDPDLQVEVYQSDKVWAGTTLLPDNHNPERPRIIEINMLGEIVWQYLIPRHLRQYTNPGKDVELLPNNNILILLPRNGIYEISRRGDILWSYLDRKMSHDADRLPNGNTLVVFGALDGVDDAQVKEVNPEGQIVWAWHARDHFYGLPYMDIFADGWTHTNAVTRLPNGNTLVSPRNFNFLVEVDSQGSIVRTIGESFLHYQHDPEVLPNGNILVVNHGIPHRAVEIDPVTDRVVWRSMGFERDTYPVRDANRLPNGNTLITSATKIVEVTRDGRVVWQLGLRSQIEPWERARRGFYKAERIF